MKLNCIIFSFFITLSLFSQEAVRIGKHVISTVDVNTSYFNNGDVILMFENSDEAKLYSEKGKPACLKVGNSLWYNWYAVNDDRGIAPAGWHIPSYFELDDLQFTCRDNIQSVIDHKNRNYLPGTPSGKDQYGNPFFKWWAAGENKQFADGFVEILECQSALGPFNFNIVKKTDFFPVRLFANNSSFIVAPIYFTKNKVFELNNEHSEWKIVIYSEDCDWGQDENWCFGKAKIDLISKKDSTKNYTISVDEFSFSINKNNEIISDLGLVFDDFNIDGFNDFGFGFGGNQFDGMIPTIFLSSKDGKRLDYNKEFNHLFSTTEHFKYDLSKRTFSGMNTNPGG